ncbi:MAG: Anti-sigma factor NepR [Hyphomicrobiales bacterium]|nr:Anti-sigma factor NepR [Hyphomicrobiales bacterium]
MTFSARPEIGHMSLSRMEAKQPTVRESVFPIHHPHPGEPALNSAVQAQIGRRLRVMFDGEAEPVPDRFQELLAQIEKTLGPAGEPR